jgi:bacteriocin-like protein
MSKQFKQNNQQHATSPEQNIREVSDKELQSITGGFTPLSGQTFVPSRNNPTAGDLYDRKGNHVGIVIGNCSAGPC